MKVSAKTAYGIRFLVYLALEYDKSFIRLKDVAEQEHISEKYLESIAASLKPLGLIEVKRGARGGYKLLRPPHEVPLTGIVDLLEGGLLSCEQSPAGRGVETCNEQVINDVWRILRLKLEGFFDNMSLGQLADNCKRKGNNGMYFI